MQEYLKVCDRDLLPLPPPIKKNREIFNKYQTGDRQKIIVKSMLAEKISVPEKTEKPESPIKKTGGLFIY